MDDVRMFNWFELCKKIEKFNPLTEKASTCVFTDDRITDYWRSCHIHFIDEKGEKIGMITFRSGYGRNFLSDFKEQTHLMNYGNAFDNKIYFSTPIDFHLK